MKNVTLLAMTLALIITSSCGKKKSSNDASPNAGVTDGPQMEEGAAQVLDGNYEAILRPLNSQVSGYLPSGRAHFNILQGNFSAKTYLDDDSRVTHIQSVHVGRRCPTLADDKNADGFIDVVEMENATGKVLISLDGDLNSEMAGQQTFPLGTSFTYEREAKAELMFHDIYATSKLINNAPLNLEGRVVMIHGTSELSRVPETVQTTADRARNVSIPITCGIIKRKI
ncbi:MAG TPA: hypothetical protein VNJ08_11645 [Bacteriovoracaceae bacterium]|nr:hypothetical protein [Bacteriovoracaceae bacterium]